MARVSPLISVILLVTMAASIVPPASPSQAGPARSSFEDSEFKLPSIHLPPAGRIGRIIPDVGVCMISIVKVEGCAADLRRSSATSHVDVSRECCEAVASLGAQCFVAIFMTFPFKNPLFPALLKEFCDEVFSREGSSRKMISLPPTN